MRVRLLIGLLPIWLCWAGCLLGQVDSSGKGLPDEGLESVTHSLGPVIIVYQLPAAPRTMPGGLAWESDALALDHAKTGTLTDLFRAAPSLSLKRYTPGGLASPSLRGTAAGHTQVYWEGLPMNSPMLGQQDFSLGSGSLFNQVGIRYGGNSLLLGAGGIGGAILLSSTQQSNYSKPIAIKYSQQVGSFGSVSSGLNLDFSAKRFSSSTKLYLQTAKNDFPFRNSTAIGAPIERLQDANFTQWGGLQEFNWQSRRWRLYAKTWAFQSARSLPPTMLTLSMGESQSDLVVRNVAGADYLAPKGYSIRSKFGYFREFMHYRNQHAGIESPSLFHRFTAECSYEKPATRFRVFRIADAGLRYVHDQATSTGFVSTAKQDLLSAYGLAKFFVSPRSSAGWSLLMRQELYGSQPSPLLGYLAFHTGRKLQFSTNVSRNYRYPTLNDRYWNPGGNPNLKPEKSLGAEMGLTLQSQYRPWKYNKAYAGVYWTDVRDWIQWLPSTGNIWRPENMQHVVARGAEVQLTLNNRLWRIADSLYYDLRLNYTFNDSRDQNGYQLIYTPRHTANIRITLRLRRWDLQYFQEYNSARYTTADNSLRIWGFTTGDLTLGLRLGNLWRLHFKEKPSNEGLHRKIFQGYHLQFGIRNIWNAEYETVAYRPMPGRSFCLRLDVDLWKQNNER